MVIETKVSSETNKLPYEPWEVTSILKCINTISFLEVVDYNDVPQQFE